MAEKQNSILLLEDEDAHIELIKRAFTESQTSYKIHTCTTLKQAREFLSDNEPDLILADNRLPDGEGTELLEGSLEKQSCPVVVMTSYGNEQVAVDAMKAGAIDYIVKSPEAFKELPRTAERVLREWGHIIERRKAEKELRESEERYRYLVENSPTPIVMFSNQKFTYANPATAKLLELSSPNEILGLPLLDFVDGQSIETVINKLSELIERPHEVHQAEVKVKTKNGNVLDTIIMAMNVPFMGESSRLITIVDITGRKKAEEEIKQKNIDLELALKVKSDFLSMVSHELRTPLVPIVGYSELLLDGSLGELPLETIEPITAIRDRADDLSKLIDDLLTLSRMERGKLRLKLETVILSPFIQEMIAGFQSTDHGKPVSFDLSGVDFRIIADRTRLRQVLGNIIENAIKYSEESVDIGFKIHREGSSGIITIKDNGIGIDSEHLLKVFDRFYQVEEIDTRSHEGTGLGLAITKELIEMMKGTIEVESTIGEGSIFTLKLPIME